MSQFELLQVSRAGFVLVDHVNQEFNALPLMGDVANIKAEGEEDFEFTLLILRTLGIYRKEIRDSKRGKVTI